jgi:hypothetical protein
MAEDAPPSPPREAFLARWSRLKRAGEGERETDGAVPAAPSPGLRPAEAPEAGLAGAAEPLPKLPDLASLTAESDFTPFMDVRVPSALRAQALARAWSLDPFIRDFKEMADYAWDWNTPGGAPGYGPLDAATDIARMLARILPDAPPPEHPAQATAAVEAPPVPEAAPAAPRAVRHSHEEPVAPQVTAQSPSIPDPEQPRPAERPRRHGGAVPT